MKRRGKDLKKLQVIMSALIEQKLLGAKHKDHTLLGEYHHCRECHIEPDWLLIYIIEKGSITFIRTGTHSDLFQ